MMRCRVASLVLAGALIAASPDAVAQLSITGDVTSETFTGYTGAGFAPSPGAGQLDSDEVRVTGLSDGSGICAFGATCTSGDFARGASNGDVNTGGIYAFGVTTGGPALGFQATSGDMDPGTITLRMVNNTGAPIANASFEYTFWYWNDQGSSQSLDFAYSTDDASYTSVAALSDDTPAAAGANAWTSVRLRRTLTGLDIPAGASLYFRWSTATTGSSARDEVAIDDVTVRLGCGNGLVEGAEVCDDFNNAAGDGCVADCSAEEAGWTCAGTQPTVCSDIDECDLATDACLANSTCDNLPGSYQCPCDAGYEGDGLTGCSNIDECATGADTCDGHATCSDTDGDYTCACDDGWEGDGFTCADVDECQLGTDDCGAGNLCINTDGAWDCACDNGFDWDGSDCVDIDECGEELADCDANATCDNFAGGFSCECNTGFEGDGLSCTATDTDGDGIPFSEDNCPGDANPDQADSDGDGRGDVCDFVDDNPVDSDGGGCGCRAAADASTMPTLLLLALAVLPLRRRRRF